MLEAYPNVKRKFISVVMETKGKNKNKNLLKTIINLEL